MKHTQGKVDLVFSEYLEKEGSPNIVIAHCRPSNTIKAAESKANANRIAALWNAADGMSTEQAVQALELGKAIIKVRDANPDNFIMTTDEAVRYLEYGAEMVKLIKELVDEELIINYRHWQGMEAMVAIKEGK